MIYIKNMAYQGFYPNNGGNAHSGLSQEDFYPQNMPSCSGINYQFPVQYVQPYSGLKSNYDAFVLQPGSQFPPEDMYLHSTQHSQLYFGNQPNLDGWQSNTCQQVYYQHSHLLSNPNQGTGQLYEASFTVNQYPTDPGNNIVLPQAHFNTSPHTMTGTQMMCRKNDSVVPDNKEDSEEKKELEAFAQEAKRRRVLLGLTQGNVGDGLGVLHGHILSQTTISRYEAGELSPSNMRKLQPIISKWFEEMESNAESQALVSKAEKSKDSAKRKRRTYHDADTKLSLLAFFSFNPHPTSKEIANIASVIKRDSKIVRNWFCNQRQNVNRELRRMMEEMEAASSHNLPLIMDSYIMPPTQSEI